MNLLTPSTSPYSSQAGMTLPFSDVLRNLLSSITKHSAPAFCAACWIPLRAKDATAELQELSLTITRLAPACQQRETKVATTSGFVVAACSGLRFHPMFGLTQTTSPLP